MLDVRRLVLLRDLAEYGTVTAVAELHGVTASAVSQQLKQLEAETGVPLVLREGRGIRLTSAGRGLVEDADAVLAALERAHTRLTRPSTEPVGPVRISCFTTAMSPLIAPLLETLARRHSGLTPHITEAEPETSLPALRQRRADLAVVYRYTHLGTPAPQGVDTHPLLTDPLLVVLPASHSAARMRHAEERDGGEGDGAERGGTEGYAEERGGLEPLALAALADTPWITAPQGTACHDATLFACRHSGFTPQIRHTCSGFAAMLTLAATGAGAVLVPALAAMPLPPGLVARTVGTPGLTRTIEAAVRRGTGERPAVAACLEALAASAAAR
ncbi:LysR family transcriptional regulator [Streptomyces sp. NPDC051776]|uniref:LysR family transcriptional regulator n=1 Tax=Streptomyces sp. NPDC051776 TaxID=3155414 RepID=UPI00341A8D8E